MSAASWASTLILLPFHEPRVSLNVHDLSIQRGHEARGMRTESENAIFKIDLEVDVTECFNWNVKE
ncbi:hypothetical protein SARC_12940, partial [Sphaeroforma arctica JP610]